MFEIGLIFLVSLVLLPFMAWALSYFDIFWTRLESGNIKYIYHGETLWKMIADVRGKMVDGHKIVTGEQRKTWLQRRFGVYWIGIPFISNVKRFKIRVVKEVETTVTREGEKKPAHEWIDDVGEREVDSLRETFTIPFLLIESELKSRQAVNVLVVCKFDVVDAYIPVPELKGGFFKNTSSTVRGAVNNIISSNFETMDDFIAANKGEGGILKILENTETVDAGGKVTVTVSEFNKRLEEQAGLHLVGAAIPEWDPSDKEVRTAMNARFIAEQEGQGAIAKATAEKTAEITRAEGVAQGRERIAQARQKEVEALRTGLDGNANATAHVLGREAQPNLTTLVENGAVSPVLPVGGEKK